MPIQLKELVWEGRVRSVQKFSCSQTPFLNFEQIGDYLDVIELGLSFDEDTTIDGKITLATLPSSISKMQSIERFSFVGKVSNIPSIFENLPKLESVILVGLNNLHYHKGKNFIIEHIEPINNPNITTFKLSNYVGSNLETILSSMPNIEVLSLNHIQNQDKIPVASLNNLRELRLYECSFKHYEQVPSCLQLFDAFLCKNIGNEAIQTICSWKNLKILKLRYISNTVKMLPDDIGTLPLSFLELASLSISAIPSSIGHIKHLKTLCLDGLSLDTLPTSLTELSNLEYLSLDGTWLRQPLEEEFRQLHIKQLRMFLSKFAGNNMKRAFYETLITPNFTKVVKRFDYNQ